MKAQMRESVVWNSEREGLATADQFAPGVVESELHQPLQAFTRHVFFLQGPKRAF
jgi:hypothetical protein